MSCVYGWEYDPNGKWSLVPEFDLVCDRDYIGHLMLTLTSVGQIIGTLIFSIMQDTIGRKLGLFIAMPWFMFWGCISVLMPSIWSYIAIKCTQGFVGLALFQVILVLKPCKINEVMKTGGKEINV